MLALDFIFASATEMEADDKHHEADIWSVNEPKPVAWLTGGWGV